MKLCKDCRYYKSIWKGVFEGEVHCCSVDRLVDVVDGEPLYRHVSVMRAADGSCGPEGKLWESKEPRPYTENHV